MKDRYERFLAKQRERATEWRNANREKLRRYNRLYQRKRRAKKNGAA